MLNSPPQRSAALLAILTVTLCPALWATETKLGDELYFSGHATLGALYTETKDAQFYRNLNQRNADFDQLTLESDSRLGLRLSYRPHKMIGGEVQLITRYGLSNNFETNLFAASARIRPGNGWQLGVGILPLESFYRSDSIHVGYSYLWARPPVEMYNFNIANNFEGISLQKRFFWGTQSLSGKLYGGVLGRQYSTHPNDQYDGSHSPLMGLTLEYTGEHLALSYGWVEFDMADEALLTTKNNAFLAPPEGGDAALLQLLFDSLVDNTDISYQYLGFAYEQGPWRLEGAAAETDSGLRVFQDTYNGYLSLGYRLDNWTPFAMVSYAHNNPPHSLRGNLPAFIEGVILEGVKAAQAEQTNLALGVRLDLSATLSLKLQFNHIEEAHSDSYLWINESPDWNGTANQFSLVMDAIF
ncbi:hypothetical protein [Halioxenophilus sp. WMMB6]|uniref:hypothetical protein n=1 Tax=Halioxenophilus sp. WMMB6 TaxID=3073815 RepID=UPI00295E82C1|nr:hypothetical protein [Halioxenophilus sp. WMMB6]